MTKRLLERLHPCDAHVVELEVDGNRASSLRAVGPTSAPRDGWLGTDFLLAYSPNVSTPAIPPSDCTTPPRSLGVQRCLSAGRIDGHCLPVEALPRVADTSG